MNKINMNIIKNLVRTAQWTLRVGYKNRSVNAV